MGTRPLGSSAARRSWETSPSPRTNDAAAIATRLIEAVLAEARSRGMLRIFLEVREGNRGARALYRTLGFETIGRHRLYYRDPPEDALIMRRLLVR